MKFKNKFLLVIALVIISFTLLFMIFQKIQEENQFKLFINNTLEIYNDFSHHIYKNFPIFEDWLNEEKTKNLRKNLYPKHIEIVRKKELSIINKHNIDDHKKNQILMNIDNSPYYFFYNVPKEFRYLHKDFIFILNIIGERFNQNLKYHRYPVQVKFSISSALRPEEYQNQLKYKNVNAIENSTHSYGISFDIFYDEFFISVNYECPKSYQEICKKIKNLGFPLSGNIRRQLQSILAETLLELQSENQLYVIWEKNQRVFHITALPLDK